MAIVSRERLKAALTKIRANALYGMSIGTMAGGVCCRQIEAEATAALAPSPRPTA